MTVHMRIQSNRQNLDKRTEKEKKTGHEKRGEKAMYFPE